MPFANISTTEGIALIGTGSNGSEPMWDDHTIQSGHHLRWFFDPSLSFPDQGFEIFRRASGPSNVIVDDQSSGTRRIRLTSDTSPIEFTFDPMACFTRMRVRVEEGQELTVQASLQGNLVSTITVTGFRTLEYPVAIDRIMLSGDGTLTLLIYDSRDPSEGDWVSIANLCLPVSSPQYLCQHPHSDGTINGDETEAIARLPQVPEIIERYVTGKNIFRDQLHPELLAIATRGVPPQWTKLTDDAPQLENVDHVGYLLLSALDPYVARILGLYFVDTEPGHFDYKIEGRWLLADHEERLFFSEMRDFELSPEVIYKGFTLTASGPVQVVENSAKFEPDGSLGILEIQMPPFEDKEITQLALIGSVAEGDYFFNCVFSDGNSQERVIGAPQNGELVSFASNGLSIVTLEIRGTGLLALQQMTYQFQGAVPQSTYVYNLAHDEVHYLPAPPFALSALELKGWASAPAPTALGKRQNAVGLSWMADVDRVQYPLGQVEELSPPSALLLAPESHDFHLPYNAPMPTVNGNEPFARLNGERLLLARPASRSVNAPALGEATAEERQRLAGLEFLITGKAPTDSASPNPPVNHLDYMQTGLQDGWYAYRLQAVDLFGRISEPGNLALVSVKNRHLPPAPLLLGAQYLQGENLPLLGTLPLMLDTMEQLWLQNNSNSDGLHITWFWSPALARQSPEVRRFKIYGPNMDPVEIETPDSAAKLSASLQSVTEKVEGTLTKITSPLGQITAIEEVAPLVFHLTTDVVLDEDQSDTFVDATLWQGSNPYLVTNHTGGENVVFWVERTKPEAAPPQVGAFVFDQSLVTVNIPFQRGSEWLIGSTLTDKAGKQSTIIAHLGGPTLHVQHSPSSGAPQVGSFTLEPYATGGLGVTITKISHEPGDQTSELELLVEAAPAIPAPGVLVGGLLKIDALEFPIVNHSAGQPAHLTASWLDAGQRPKAVSGAIFPPALATLVADRLLSALATEPIKSSGVLVQKDQEYVVLAWWEGEQAGQARTHFLVQHPSGSSPPQTEPFTYYPVYESILPVSPQISGARVAASPTPHLEMPDTFVVPTDKRSDSWRWFGGGELAQAGKMFRVVGSTTNAELLVQKHADGSLPAVGEFIYRPVSSEEPATQGTVNINALDVDGESAPSTSLAVTAVYRAKLPPPNLEIVPPAAGCLRADRADWYGVSAFTLAWQATLGQMFRVYRALDGSLYELDREHVANLSRTWAGGSATITTADLPTRLQNDAQEPQIRQAIQQDFNTIDAAISAWKSVSTTDKQPRLADLEAVYKGVRNDTHEVLANRSHVASAFVMLTEQPLQATGNMMQFHDKLPGRSSNRFFYRVGLVDAAGNASELSRPTPPICCPDVTPPARPNLIEAIGGPKKITLRWRENTEPDLDKYLLYRTDKNESAKDIRLMDSPIHIATSGNAVLRAGEIAPSAVANAALQLQMQDNLSPNVTYYYRLVAVDANNNASEPSSIVVGRGYQPPPAPPVLALPTWDQAHQKLTLTWSSSDPKLRCRVARRNQGDTDWVFASSWLSWGHYIYTDQPPDSNSKYEYRIHVRDYLGQPNETYQSTTTP